MRFAPLSDGDPVEVGGHRLSSVLGCGGMGRVYLSFTPGGRALAIKVMRAEIADDPEFRRRFRQEVRAAQRVQGIFTAPVVDADADAPVPWLATAYVAGPSLQEAVAEHGALPTTSLWRLLAGTAEALLDIHRAGLIHRDLKPGNLLLADDGPRVIDFGIAHAVDATSHTRTGASAGTPAFMAPEQIRGETTSEATDVFALGGLLVFAATGHAPFGEGRVEALLYRIIEGGPVLADCPDGISQIAARCLAKDPLQRPGVDKVLAQTLDHLPHDLPEAWLPGPLTTMISGYRPPAAPTRPRTGVTETRQAYRAGSTAQLALTAGVVAGLTLIASMIGLAVFRGDQPQSSPSTAAPKGTTVPAPTKSAPQGSPAFPASPQGTQATRRYVEDGYKIDVPRDWTRRTKDGSVSIYWHAPDGTAFLQGDPEDWSGTPRYRAEQASRGAAADPERFPGYKLIGIKDVKYRGLPAADWDFSFDDPQGGAPIRSRDRFFRESGRTYAIYFRAGASSWPSYQEPLTAIYQSFTPA